MIRILLTLFLGTTTASGALGQGVVFGRAADLDTGAPLAWVRVTLEAPSGDAAHIAWTDAAGRFFLEAVPPGRYDLHVFRENAPLDATAVDIRPGENVFHLDLTRRP